MIDELANRADWDAALRQGYKGSYAEWKHDRQDWMDFREEFIAGKAGTNDFYDWKEKRRKAKDLDLSYQAALEMGFTGTRDQWAKFINTMRGPSAYELWVTNNAEDIQDIFGKESISEKEWTDLLFSKEYLQKISYDILDKTIHPVTEEEMDKIIDEIIAEKEG